MKGRSLIGLFYSKTHGTDMKNSAKITLLATAFFSIGVFAQGQDSQPEDRDLLVIATMLLGGFDNANQNYFDTRGKHDVKHRRIHAEVVETEEENVLVASAYWDNDPDVALDELKLTLSANPDAGAVEMQVSRLGDSEGDSCSLYWRREAAQFHATPAGDCDSPIISEVVLGQQQVWVDLAKVENGDFKMHRIRNFECYADIPGVGGGRDEAYERYEGFKIHDQGGAVWFDSKDGRRLGISLFLADWPINNYEGIFTRDSFVIYASEEIDGVRKEHGYAFTVPDADRIGINLKWMLASCFMKSNKYATPYM
jgi:hypothetical protein